MIDQALADDMWTYATESFEPVGDRDSELHALLAHHEAGHLVAGYVADATLAGVTVQPQDRYGGLALFFIGGEARGATLDNVIATMSGPTAARRYEPKCRDDGGTFDRERVEVDLQALARTDEARDVLRAYCQAKAEQLVDAHWDLITAVADALLAHDTLDATELRQVISDVEADRAAAREPERRKAWSAAVANAATFRPSIEADHVW